MHSLSPDPRTVFRLWLAYQRRVFVCGLLAGGVAGFALTMIADMAAKRSASWVATSAGAILVGLLASYLAFRAVLIDPEAINDRPSAD